VTFAGTYNLVVKKPEFESAFLQVEVKDGKPAKLEARLVSAKPKPVPVKPPPPPPPPVTGPPRRPLWRLAVGGAAVGVGVIVLGFGLSALGVNGQCVLSATPPATQCRRLFDTVPVGAGLTVTGLAVAAGGVVLIALPPRAPRAVAELSPGPADFGLTLVY
jgi:hypothetical protein